MKSGSYSVVQPLVSAVAKHHMVPFDNIIDDRFWENNLPDSGLYWIRDVNNSIKGVYFFMCIVLRIDSDLLLQPDVPCLMVNDIDCCCWVW